jgi:hypothetical protein
MNSSETIPSHRAPRKLLIVTPRFPPVNAPDYNRIRTALAYFKDNGYEPTVLCVAHKFIDREKDPDLLSSVPEYVEIEQVDILDQRYTRFFGVRGLAWRCIWPLFARGTALLKAQKFDLIYFSSTVFITFPLGRLWKRRFQTPFVVDYQDPWQNDFYKRTNTTPPGGKLRFAFARFIAFLLEPFSLRAADGITAVSQNYLDSLLTRYPFLNKAQTLFLPFGASTRDFELLDKIKKKNPCFNSSDGRRHWCYVGRGGTDMHYPLRALFQAIAEDRTTTPDNWANIQLHFIGTQYASTNSESKEIASLAADCGIADIVSERTARVSHFEYLQILRECELFILPGSTDSAYFPSKTFQTLLAQKPVLALLHRDGPSYAALERLQAPYLLGFHPDTAISEFVSNILHLLPSLHSGNPLEIITTDHLEEFTAERATKALCQFFDQVLSQKTECRS